MSAGLILAAAAGDHGSPAEPIFHIGPIPVPVVIFSQWIVMAVVLLGAWLAARGLQRVPSGRLQSLVEILMEGILAFFGNILDEKRVRKYITVPASLLLFIIVSNYSGLLPFLPDQPWYVPPTSYWGVTAGLALFVFLYVHFTAILAGRGRHYLHWFDPLWLSWLRVPLGLIEEVARPFSLSLRLFANVFAGETLLALLLLTVPYFLPAGVMGLELITGAVQALIFSMLTAVYLSEVTEH